MTGKGEYYVRCKKCGRLIKVFKEPTRAYCTNCEKIFDYDTQDIVFSGITTNPSDYRYEWKEEKNIEEELAKYKRAFEILKEKLDIDVTDDTDLPEFNESYTLWAGIEPATISKEQYELLKELINNESR